MGRPRGAWTALAALLLTLFFAGSIPAQAQSPGDAAGDYGDAPDTTNSTRWPMNAYPWNEELALLGFVRPASIPANYPTVVDPAAAAPQGPWHRHPRQRAWLGLRADREADADRDPGPSGWSNIRPGQNVPALEYGDGYANLDDYDDAIAYDASIALPDCAETSFAFTASGAEEAGATRNYLNVWFDFNRDGDFNDTILCRRSSDQAWQSAPEQAVRNMPITVAPGQTAFTTSVFRSSHPDYRQMIWMRMTLTAAEVASTDGSGPAEGYLYGETEDYLLTNYAARAAADVRALSGGSGESYYPIVLNVGYYTGGY